MPIEQVEPGLDRIVSPNEEVEWLGGGYGGVDERGRLLGVAEGPVWWKAGGWWKDGGYLLFSDIAASRRHKWTPAKGLSVIRRGPTTPMGSRETAKAGSSRVSMARGG